MTGTFTKSMHFHYKILQKKLEKAGRKLQNSQTLECQLLTEAHSLQECQTLNNCLGKLFSLII